MREIAGLRQSTIARVSGKLDFPPTKMWPAGSGTGGTGGLVIKVIIIFFFRNSKSCQSRESCALGRTAEPRGHHLVREPSCARTSLARRRWFRHNLRNVKPWFLLIHATADLRRTRKGSRPSRPGRLVSPSRLRKNFHAFSMAFKSGECLGWRATTSTPMDRNAARGSGHGLHLPFLPHPFILSCHLRLHPETI